MNKTRLLVLVSLLAFVAFGLFVLWRGLGAPTDGSQPTPSPRAATTEAPARPGELSTPTEPAKPAVEESRTSALAPEANDLTRGENFTLDGARWIEGRVVIPFGAPADETLQVWAVDLHGESSAGVVYFGDGEDPTDVLQTLRESSSRAAWSHRALAADGGFRIPCPADATVVDVVLDGRFLYLEGTRHVTLDVQDGPLVLEPKLGGCIVGRCRVPANAAPADLAAGGSVTAFAFSLSGPKGPSGVRRERRLEGDFGFELRALPPLDNYSIQVAPDRMAGASESDVHVVAGETRELEVQIRLGARLAGRVVDEHGAPVADAHIEARGAGKGAERRGMNFAAMFAKPRGTDTGADGRFDLAGIEPGSTILAVTHDGFVAFESPAYDVREGETRADLELQLSRGDIVAGKVLFGDGRPAANAQVTAQPAKAQRGLPTAQNSAVTDAAGAFEISGLEKGPYQVKAMYVVPAEPQAAGADASGDQAKTANSGADDGAAATGATGAAESKSKAGKPATTTATNDGPRAGASTRSRPWNSRRPGRTSRAVLADGQSELGAAVWVASADDVAANTRDVKLVLDAPPGLAGRVVDELGAPVASFQVSLEADWKGGTPIDTTLHAKKFQDETGRFELAGVPAGSWKVVVQSEGFVQVGDPPTVTVPTQGDLVLTVARAASITGRVVDPLGAPIAKATVQRRTQGDQNPWSGFGSDGATSDEEGRFELTKVPIGAWELNASSEEWAKSAPLPVTLAAGQKLEGVLLTLRRGGTLEGEVYDERGASSAGRTVQLFSMGAGDMRQATVEDGGHFRVEHLTPGTFQVMLQPDMKEIEKIASSGDGKPDPGAFLSQMKMTSCEIKDDEVTHVVLGAPPKAPVKVHGRITQGGQPVGKCTVMTLNEGSALMQNMKFGQVQADGEYSITLNEPGDVVLVVSKEFGGNDGIDFYLSIPDVPDFKADLALPISAIRGTVRGPDGRPLAGIPVQLLRDSSPSNLMMMGGGRSNSSGDDGRYEFHDLEPGRYGVAAGGGSGGMFGTGGTGGTAEYGRVVRGGLEVAADKTLDGIDIKLDAPGTIRGVLKDAAGQPVTGATVYARDKNGELVNRMSGVTSDASGQFTYGGLSAGPYTVSARTKTLVARDSAPVTVRGTDTTAIELVLEPGTMLNLVITDKDDKPLRASISIKDERGFEVSNAVALDGMMETMSKGISTTERKIGPLAPGKYVVTATTRDGKTAKKSVTLSGQDERKLRLRVD